MGDIFEEMNLSTKDEERDEIKLYNKFYFPQHSVGNESNVDFSKILSRQEKIYRESRKAFPQNIFFISYGRYIVVGRKLISEKHLNNTLKELHCSAIRSYMLFGVLDSYEDSDLKIDIVYKPFTNSEKKAVFDKIRVSKDSELIYPFRYFNSKGEERHSPELGWQLNPLRAENLSLGEDRIRKYTIKFLKKFTLKNKILYDPACSTGKFLATIKKDFPDCYTIGQDLSPEMVNYARQFVDEIHLGDSMQPAVQRGSVDFCFIRFLNSEVVTTEQAKKLFVKLRGCIKESGIIVVLGHTPILLQASFFYKQGLDVINKIAYDEEDRSIFQYYVLKNKKGVRNG